MMTLQQVLAMALSNAKDTRIADAPIKVQPTITAGDLERADTSQVLAQAFAQVSRVVPPQVAEPIELLWRNAYRARDERPS